MSPALMAYPSSQGHEPWLPDLDIYTQSHTAARPACKPNATMTNSKARGRALISHLHYMWLRKGHGYILLTFSGFEPAIPRTQTISCGASNERRADPELMAEAVIGK